MHVYAQRCEINAVHFFFTRYLVHYRFAFCFIPELGLVGQTFNLSSVEQTGKDKKLNSDCHIPMSIIFFLLELKNISA